MEQEKKHGKPTTLRQQSKAYQPLTSDTTFPGGLSFRVGEGCVQSGRDLDSLDSEYLQNAKIPTLRMSPKL
jgi:hypothetical protein